MQVWTRWLAAVLLGLVLVLQVLMPGATADTNPGGYAIASPTIQAYLVRHGGARVFGAPISNQFRLLGSQVQLFERHGIELRPDGSVGLLNLMESLPWRRRTRTKD